MIELKDVAIAAGGFSLAGVNLRIPQGKYGVLMGKTGCGKSTILEAIAGLKRVTAGTICLAGEDVTEAKPALRAVGFVPQDSALFPGMTVAENLTFALDIRGAGKEEQDARRQELAGLLGLEALLERYPANLSGGERQRVALGRAISFRPTTLLLDEPLSAVDENTREEMHDLLKSVQQFSSATILHVTHSRGAAERLADLRFELVDGRICS